MAEQQLHVVGVGAHPDDIGYGMGGVVASYVRRGHRATILNVTYGETVRPPGPEQEEAKRVRRKEGEDIAERLGAAVECIGLPGNTIIPSWEMKSLLVNWLRRLQANVIFYPTPWDTHADHRNLSWTMRDVMYYVGHAGMAFDAPPCRLLSAWMYELEFAYNELHEPDLLFDVTDVFDTKVASLRDTRPIFGVEGQAQTVDEVEVWGRWCGLRAGVRYAEPLYQTWGNMRLASMSHQRNRVREVPLIAPSGGA